MKNKRNKIMTLAIFLSLCIPLVRNVFMSPVYFSEIENRVLAQNVRWDKELLKSGVLAERVESYVQDQFPLRDLLINLKSDLQVIQGREENNGIYRGRDGYLFEKVNGYDEAVLKANLKSAITLAAKLGDDLRIICVPPSSLILEEKLPDHTDAEKEKEIMAIIGEELKHTANYLDVTDLLKERKDEGVYFKTDHHWTQYGAYVVYQELMNSYGLMPVDNADFSMHKTTDFQGTFYSRFRGNFVPGEEFTIFEPEQMDLHVEYEGENRREKNIFFKENLVLRDKYRVYLDGNFPLVRIMNHKMTTGEKILVLKDSYANAMIPYLTDSFKEVHMLDLRYYNLSLMDYMEKEGFQKIILLYGMDSYTEDINLKKLSH